VRNERLADAIRHTGRTVEMIAEQLGVDPKTVHRWVIDGRLPHSASRAKLSALLDVPSAMLWPQAPSQVDGTREVTGVYTTRSQVSPATLASILSDATQHIDLLAFAALWLWDSIRDFSEILERKISDGVEVRICLGDPYSDAVRMRGNEEGLGDSLSGRCELAIKYASTLQRPDRPVVRLSGRTLYATMFRFDNDLLLNTHLWGNGAVDSPVLHLRRVDERGIFANAMRSFERVWNDAQPLGFG
jgi:transposase-like protein